MKFRLSVAIATILASDDSSVYARNYIRNRHAHRSLSSGKGSMNSGAKGKGSSSKAPSAPSKGSADGAKGSMKAPSMPSKGKAPSTPSKGKGKTPSPTMATPEPTPEVGILTPSKGKGSSRGKGSMKAPSMPSKGKAPSAPSKGSTQAAVYVVLSDECIDNEDYAFLSWHGDLVGCWWITEHDSTTANRQAHHCHDEEFAANCCAACLN